MEHGIIYRRKEFKQQNDRKEGSRHAFCIIQARPAAIGILELLMNCGPVA